MRGRATGPRRSSWAVYRENQEAVDLLIRTGAVVNVANDLGVTPFWVAASNASAAIVATLLRAGANPNLAPATGGTPLMLASRNGDAASVKALLSHGADVNAKEEANGQTALMWALGQQHSEIVGILLDAGADIRARTKSSQRVVLLCCPTWAGDPEGTVTIDQGGLTPLLFTAVTGDIAIRQAPFGCGRRCGRHGRRGATALVMAAASLVLATW